VVSSVPVTGPAVTLNGDGQTAVDGDDVEEDRPPTPEDIQVNAADVESFDQTFLAQSQNFKLEGQFSPAPFPLQVLPRVAYTINYNFIYNEDRGRWEADTGNRSTVEPGLKPQQQKQLGGQQRVDLRETIFSGQAAQKLILKDVQPETSSDDIALLVGDDRTGGFFNSGYIDDAGGNGVRIVLDDDVPSGGETHITVTVTGAFDDTSRTYFSIQAGKMGTFTFDSSFRGGAFDVDRRIKTIQILDYDPNAGTTNTFQNGQVTTYAYQEP